MSIREALSESKKNLRLNMFEDYISYCKHCKFCRDAVRKAEPFGFTDGVCPFNNYTSGFDPLVGAAGKIQIVKGLFYGAIKPTKEMAQDIYQCTTCGACKQWCAALVDTVGIYEALRADLVNAGVAPMPEHKMFEERIKSYNNPYAEDPKKRLNWVPPNIQLPKAADVVYFVGCTSALRLPEIAQSIVNILNKLKVDFALLPEEVCCGSIMFRTGMRDVGEELVKKVMEMIYDTKASTVIFSCAGCYKTFSTDYPEILGESIDVELKHITQYLMELDQLKPVKRIDAKVTYHDPCHLGRHMEVFEPPRTLLNKIPGIELVEMGRNKAGAFCCGAGGGVKGAFPEIALAIANDRVIEAKETESSIIASACPFCKRNLADALEDVKSPMKMYDVVELIADSLEVRPRESPRREVKVTAESVEAELTLDQVKEELRKKLKSGEYSSLDLKRDAEKFLHDENMK